VLATAPQSDLLRRASAWLGIGKWERDDSGRLRRGTWFQTWSGQKFYVLDPRPEEVHYDDVCVGIARACRYGNHCRDFFSVATHSVIVSQCVYDLAMHRGWSDNDALMAAREGLMHDATEAYLGDIPRPLKRQREMAGYCRVEKRLWPVICQRFEIHSTPESTALVKEVDTRVLLDEIEALMIDPDMWDRAGRYKDVAPLGVEIPVMEWRQSADVFSQRFDELFGDWVRMGVEFREMLEAA
jgi:uncharacterized protein